MNRTTSAVPDALMFIAVLLICIAGIDSGKRIRQLEDKAKQLPPKVTVELSPEVRYAIQEETRKAMIEHRKLMTRPILPMVAPDPKTKVKR